jgi:hypothetical protein
MFARYAVNRLESRHREYLRTAFPGLGNDALKFCSTPEGELPVRGRVQRDKIHSQTEDFLLDIAFRDIKSFSQIILLTASVSS